ncbi:CsgG/HfaB family protein [Pedobacter sp. UBA4863]|uniref:CsgG/HfaB family protein n=1 Tax=Pedobacter sp. UBA4863 TaxID=1947060 RepID=UPI0025F10EC5|nr:CsgG/HfaB family protein [Pedobacter sp. UBA4863]
MKKRLFILLLSFTSYSVVAQDRIAVAIIPITFNENNVSASDAKIIQETVLNTFVATKRFTVVDREKLQDIEKEKKLQRSEAFMDSQNGVKEGVTTVKICRSGNYLL